METQERSEDPKNTFLFICKKCDFKCCKKSLYNRHLLTAKHKKQPNGNQMETQKRSDDNFICTCKKTFLTKSGLWKHKQKCFNKNEIILSKYYKDSNMF